MTDGFDWVPFYEEVAERLLAYRSRQPELVSILADAKVQGLADENPKKVEVPLTEIDPLTFIALINKHTKDRGEILSTVKKRLGVMAAVPTQFLGIPSTNAQQCWLFSYAFERDPGDVGKLWDLFEAVMSSQPLSERVLAAAQSVKYAGHAKLTQAIFRAAPRRYFPVDGQTERYLFRLNIGNKFKTAAEYRQICQLVAQSDAGKAFYEHSHLAWKQNREIAPSAEEDYQRKARKLAADGRPIVEKPGGEAVPDRKPPAPSTGGYVRNPRVAGDALKLAGYRCEIDPSHFTFTAQADGKPYLEAHHLIPFSHQRSYPMSLDVLANVVALCPHCHRLLHHGTKKEKEVQLRALLAIRADRLELKRLKISAGALLNLYNKELVQEDS